MIRFALIGATIALLSPPAMAKDKTPRTWKATRTSDAITGATSCVVSAIDYVGSFRYSRTGYLYPIIEMNSAHGLLIGVSSGGRYRMPSGNILWRVDDKPFRELKAENNPANQATTIPGGDIAAKTMAETTALTTKLLLAATATSTLASGELAKEMLAELRTGQGLIYRAAAISSPYGLPDPKMNLVGQFGKDGLKPIPVDSSLEAALTECAI